MLALICGCWFPFVQSGTLTLSKAREARKFFRWPILWMSHRSAFGGIVRTLGRVQPRPSAVVFALCRRCLLVCSTVFLTLISLQLNSWFFVTFDIMAYIISKSTHPFIYKIILACTHPITILQQECLFGRCSLLFASPLNAAIKHSTVGLSVDPSTVWWPSLSFHLTPSLILCFLFCLMSLISSKGPKRRGQKKKPNRVTSRLNCTQSTAPP